MLSEIIGSVGFAGPPIDLELSLADTVTDPIKAHIHGFGSFLLDGLVGNPVANFVVSGHGGRSLRMPELGEGDALGYRVLAIDEEAGEFAFSHAGKDGFEDLAGDADSSIERRWRRVGVFQIGAFVTEVVKSGHTRSCLRFGEVRGVAFDIENHVAGMISDLGVGVGRSVVEELGDCLHGELGGGGLFGGNGSNSSHHGKIDGASVKQKRS